MADLNKILEQLKQVGRELCEAGLIQDTSDLSDAVIHLAFARRALERHLLHGWTTTDTGIFFERGTAIGPDETLVTGSDCPGDCVRVDS